MEVWKPILGTEYEASSNGRIRRVRVMSQTKHKCGYMKVGHRKGTKYLTALAHRLVAEAFLGVCPQDKMVNHKDGNKSNNRPGNLEYVTREENAKHAVRTGLYKRGGKHPRAKLTDELAAELVARWRTGKYTAKELAKTYNISRSTAHKIATGVGY